MPDNLHDDEWISEDALARELNVDRQVLRAERPHLLAGEVTQREGAVVWLRSAGRRVAEKLGLPLPSSEKSAATAAERAARNGEAATDDVETFTVVGQALNRNIVNAQRASGEVVCVRVVDNRKYVPRLGNGKPMTLRARKSATGNWWVLVGREPRWPGIY